MDKTKSEVWKAIEAAEENMDFESAEDTYETIDCDDQTVQLLTVVDGKLETVDTGFTEEAIDALCEGTYEQGRALVLRGLKRTRLKEDSKGDWSSEFEHVLFECLETRAKWRLGTDLTNVDNFKEIVETVIELTARHLYDALPENWKK